MEFNHVPVLLQECLDGLNIKPDGIYLDGTAGGGGHSSEIARRLTTGHLGKIRIHAAIPATEPLNAFSCIKIPDIITLTSRAYKCACTTTQTSFGKFCPFGRIKDFQLFPVFKMLC